ncbi:hypothetical protein R3W88_027222 [Solanum pinnatisectum]|uniref:Uncharacterized protein n=1 Tax=Solanum pinnatisectum TaxID=50273 RepID=A0AAV9LG58_9SOLN|nr:hypothetical protein R3W88_027222 [Solanum pinnatisectum]
MEGEHSRMLATGRVVGPKQNRQEWMVRGRNKYNCDKNGQIEGENDLQDENPFEALGRVEENEEVANNQEGTPQVQKVGSTKEQEDKEEDLKCALVLFEPNKEEVLPLAIHNDNHEGASDTEKTNMDKIDLIKNVEKAAIEGDLSPK